MFACDAARSRPRSVAFSRTSRVTASFDPNSLRVFPIELVRLLFMTKDSIVVIFWADQTFQSKLQVSVPFVFSEEPICAKFLISL